MGRMSDRPTSPNRSAERELYLLRHAHAGDPVKWSGDDARRPLSRKGRQQAERLGEFLAARGIRPDALLSSPKLRALETAQIVGRAIGREPVVDERLGAPLSLAGLDHIVAGADRPSVAVVGHDPDFSELATQLIGAAGLRLRKGAIACFAVSLPLHRGAGELLWLLPPEVLG
jgi:phosphohistidine phosphatase